MDLPALQNDLRSAYGLDLRPAASIEELEGALAEKINAMILADFNGLVQLLYRIDVSEARVRQLLKENSEVDAGSLIARLILDRVGEKLKTRKMYRAPGEGSTAGEEERW